MTIWQRLSKIRTLHFEAHSVKSTGWNGEGSGHVTVDHPAINTLVFSEHGTWTPRGATPLTFRNVFRWTYMPRQHIIRLEHLRRGPEQPVYLFDLRYLNPHTWQTIKPHQCNQDIYKAEITLDSESILMNWSIQGPNKQETITYTYT